MSQNNALDYYGKLLENYPDCEEILGTDFSLEMVGTARRNLQKCGRKNISFT